MIYHHLFRQTNKKNVTAAVIGTGHFGKAIVTQQKYNNFVNVKIVMDKNLDSARNALLDADIKEDIILYCDNATEARNLLENGKYIYTDKLDVILKTKEIDIVCEGTGVPEAGALHAEKAIRNGKHVAMINKETDSAVGPILKKIAEEAGVIYTPVDGDQHGLLMSMYEWAKEIGLTVISGGKARDGEFVYDENSKNVSIEADGLTVHETVNETVSEKNLKYLNMIPEGKSKEYVEKRMEILKDLPGAGSFDLCELTIMANSTNLSPDQKGLHSAPLRITELPVAYCNESNGGVFEREEVIDLITCFRRPDESGMGGGVYLVVRCDNAYSNYILTTKGQIHNYDKSTAVIYRPYHLCGIETSISLASASLLKTSTGSLNYKPRYDLIKFADRDIKAGETLGDDHDLSLKAELAPAKKMNPNNPIPGHLITGNKAKVDIKKGELLTYEKIEKPNGSILWNLRKQQDDLFIS